MEVSLQTDHEFQLCLWTDWTMVQHGQSAWLVQTWSAIRNTDLMKNTSGRLSKFVAEGSSDSQVVSQNAHTTHRLGIIGSGFRDR